MNNYATTPASAAQRIIRYLEKQGISLLENERKTSIGRRKLDRMAKGESKAPLSDRDLIALANAYSLCPDYIRAGIPPMFMPESGKCDTEPGLAQSKNHETEQDDLPQTGTTKSTAREDLELFSRLSPAIQEQILAHRPGLLVQWVDAVWPANDDSDINEAAPPCPPPLSALFCT